MEITQKPTSNIIEESEKNKKWNNKDADRQDTGWYLEGQDRFPFSAKI